MHIFTLILTGFITSQAFASDNYLQKGNDFQKSAQRDSANYFYKLAIPGLIHKNEYEKLTNTYRSIGNNFIRLELKDSALHYISLSINTAKLHLKEPDLALMKAYNSKASMYGSLRDYHKSAEYFKLALHHHLLSKSDKKPLTAKLYNNIGTIYNLIGELDSAIIYLEHALALKTEIYQKEDKNLSSTYNNLGILYVNRGYYSDAIKTLKLALNTEGIEENTTNLIKIYHNLGMASQKQGDLDLAESYLLKELNLFNEFENVNYTDLALNYNSLGNIYNRMGKFNTGLVQYNTSLSLLEEHDAENFVDMAMVLNNIGNTHINLEEFINAETAFSNSLLCYEKLNYRNPLKGLLFSNFGKMYRMQTNYNKAIQYYHQSNQYYYQIFNEKHPSIAENYIELGKTFFDQGEIDSSLFYLDKAGTLLHLPLEIENINETSDVVHKDMGLTLLQYQTNTLLKEAEFPISGNQEKYLLEQVILKCEMSVGIIHEIRKSFLFSQSKYLLSETIQGIYANGVKSAYRLYNLTGQDQYLEIALRFSEYSRASIFRETIAAYENTMYANIPEDIIHTINRMKSDISYYQNEINLEEGNPAPEIDVLHLAHLQNLQFSLISKYDSYMQFIKLEYPDFYNLLHPERELKLEAILNNIGNNEIIVEFFQWESTIYIFCMSNSQIVVKKIPLKTDFDQMVNTFITSIKKIQSSQFYDSGIELYNILLLPISREFNGIHKITFILGGTLSSLPFEALPLPPSQPYPNNLDIRFLVEQFEVSYSLTAEKIERSAYYSDRELSNIAVFAPVNNFTPNFENNALFEELVYSQQEAESIASKGADNKIETDMYLHSEASEENFKSVLKKENDILHIATHGFLNEDSPDLSALYFSNPENPGEDGILFSAELYNLNIQTDLTVLSGCETGLGKMVNGEGVLSLSRGFSYAGSKNIVYTLWKVGDQTSFTLMANFYEQIFKERNYSKALRNAKLQMISNEETSLPRFWSGYVLLEN
ncbi:MAG: CHAT domain-containing protein [Candidatus Marinimicrobia bacterium]|jgi:CHAT domain-containing protein|nr:CHAT domain-containing protein [Candidatus Neomarinimicrobiota bacterium]